MDPEAPKRVSYFSGQRLDADDFRDEQDYHLGKHRRLTRLAVGSGVLCGLGVSVTGDAQVVVEPGIAFDPLGHEIILGDAQVLVDPFRPTDDDGQPSGPPVRGGPVTLSVRYAERPVAGGPVLSRGIGEEDGDGPTGRIMETFRIVVRKGAPRPAPGLSAAQLGAFLPAAPARGFDRRLALLQIMEPSWRAPESTDVVLASIKRSRGGRGIIVDLAGRRDLYSAAQLLDLVLSLADRLSAIEHPAGTTAAARARR